MKKVSLTLSILFCVIVALTATAEDPIVIASKNFPESFILAEMMSQILESEGYTVERKFNLAGTKVCFDALVAGEVDIYPEYTGTVLRVILGTEEELPLERINAELEPQNVRFLQPFGFNNSYAITVTSEIASRRNLKNVSDLVNQNDLKVFFSHEFIERMDGWPGLRE
ncbi:MAG: amino acid ABC transporter permease, partial [Gammaproteobacteria bacterium]|nr:amino acid ABC transporter permease [Gammaproteobacteria bacterium]